ncbi:hypothetical protein HFD88_009342 [Aspergillus terreus]|nr:hypothetical protein HFD88_009342 [Aspergillus terreus]
MEGKGPSFKVIIVGASVTGLTLAHCLHRAGIDYVVLEKHHEVHPPIGAAVAILPNGGRIMEQLGIFRHIEDRCQPFQRVHLCFQDGFYYDSLSPSVVLKRFGLKFAALERTQLLEILYTHLPDKSRILTSKGVVRITPHDSKMSVTTADGDEFQGDLVVGADGVHSVTRREMWRIANIEQPGLIPFKEQASMSVEFSCIFGMSNPIAGRKRWQHIIRIGPGFTFLIFPAAGDSLFWVLIEKLPHKYIYPDVPRFSQEDAIARCEAAASQPIWEEVRFRDIWLQRRGFRMVALEENLFRTWHHGRIICIGDSISKMTPNIGQGANTAIEAAAGLANVIYAITQNHHQPSDDTIHRALATFSERHRKRLDAIHLESRWITRLEACQGWVVTAFTRYVAPHCGDLFALGVVRNSYSGEVLQFLPLTERSGKHWPKLEWWNTWGLSKWQEFGERLVYCFGVVILLWISWAVFNVNQS